MRKLGGSTTLLQCTRCRFPKLAKCEEPTLSITIASSGLLVIHRVFTPAFFLLNVARSYDFQMTRIGDYLNALESAIRMRHECSPTHRQTVFIRAKTKAEETVWEGFVEEFELTGHKRAKKCYAWRHMESSDRSKIIAILGNHFIDSAQKAVEAAIFTDTQPPERKFSEEMDCLAKQLQECKDLIRRMGIKSDELSASIDATRQFKKTCGGRARAILNS